MSILSAANPAGTGVSQLAYIGDFIYANSGAVDAANSDFATQLEFTTAGNRVIVGNFTLNGAILNSDVDTGSTCAFEILLNNETILKTKVNTLSEETPGSIVVPIIIPPQSKIKVRARCTNTNGQTSVNLTGRTYG